MAQLTLPVNPARDHFQGFEDAPVTLVEYGDYECPHCGRAHPIVRAVQQAMGDQLRFVFRNFPLSEMHPHAQHAALASESAGEQGVFWEMHHALFTHQRDLSDTAIKTLATQVGADPEKTISEILLGKHEPKVKEDFLSGVRSGVNGTPTFFINGVRFEDSWDEETLLKALQKAAGDE
jgi:protein-disulfide isomerase